MLGIVPQPRPAANARGPNCVPHKPRPGPFVWSGPCLVRGKHVGRRPVTNPLAAVFHRQKAAARDQRVPGGCSLYTERFNTPAPGSRVRFRRRARCGRSWIQWQSTGLWRSGYTYIYFNGNPLACGGQGGHQAVQLFGRALGFHLHAAVPVVFPPSRSGPGAAPHTARGSGTPPPCTWPVKRQWRRSGAALMRRCRSRCSPWPARLRSARRRPRGRSV